ncbi:MAG: N-acetyl-gamma-glutamyl-phosphate reductase [Candidatus Syntropharchaeia archaeon]
MIEAGIIGASGYMGIELVRLLLAHPEVELTAVTSRRYKGKKVSEVNPHLKSLTDLVYEDVNPSRIADSCDVVFTAVPHGTAMKYVPALIKKTKVIDLSADYRLNVEEYEKIYGKHSDPRKGVYGLCEIHPEVKYADLVANPGCYPTGAILAVFPLVSKGIVERIIFDAKSGISGAGAEPTATSHFPNLAENIIPYSITTHRHRAELVQELKGVEISFTPHVIPSIRGILTTAHVFTKEKMEKNEIEELYLDFYEKKPFIRLGGIPSLSNVRSSNFCDIGFEIEEGTNRIVVISAIDNLMKGGSGQAVQNMNLMFGLDERTGLWGSGLYP